MWRANFLSSGNKETKRLSDTDRSMYLTAFLVPFFIVAGIYLVSEVWPVGTQCFLKTDMYHQYAPFYAEFRRKLREGGSLFYSYNAGLGVNFLALTAYYLASPGNLLVALAPEDHVIEFMNLLMIVRVSLCSLSFTYYLRKHFKKEDAGYVFFGIAYGLSGYICAYYWNMMWLPVIILFPLVILSLEILIKEGRVFPYALLLGCCIFTNYYISIMVCIFLVVWFFALNVLYTPKNFKTFMVRGMKFALGSIAAGLFAGVLLLPAYFALEVSASASSTFPKTVKEYFAVIDVLGRMLPAVNTEQALEHWPNIYAGTFVLLLIPLYLMSRRISTKEKAVYMTVLLFLIAGFSYNFLEYIWHGLHFPNSLPAREGFTFDFLVLFVCARVYLCRKSITKKQAAQALFLAVIFVLFTQKGADSKYYSTYTFWIALLFCGLYFACLCLCRKKTAGRMALVLFTLSVLISDVTVNAALTSFTTCSRTYYTEDNEDIRELYDFAVSRQKDNDLVRFERIQRRTKNDGAWLGYPSVSLFSSTAYADCSDFFKKIGCEASTNAYSITGSTPVVDTLLNIGYAFYPEELELSEGKHLIDSAEHVSLYENENATALGYIIPRTLSKSWIFEFDNPVLIQNSICDVLMVPQALEEIITGAVESDQSYTIYLPEDGEYYAFVGNTSVKKVTVSGEGSKKEYDNLDRKYLIELGERKQDEYLKISPESEGKDMKLKLYRVNYDAVAALSDALMREPFRVTERTDTKITGTVTSSEDAAELFLSLPYDEGWTCTVDGRNTEIHKGFGETFLGITVDAGTHEITLRYCPKGFKPGLLATLSGILMMVMFWIVDKKAKEEKRRAAAIRVPEQTEETEILDKPNAEVPV